MAGLSATNPLSYIINRQFNERVRIKTDLFRARLTQARNLFRKNIFAHYGCVNAIEFSSEGELLISGGDDRRVLLWSVPKVVHGRASPTAMTTNHVSNIFCLSFDSTNSKIFSGGNDDQVIIHDLKTCSFIVKLLHKKPVYGLSVNPQNDYVIATAGDDGRILMYDIRESTTTEPLCVAKQKTGFHSVMFNPFNSRLIAAANSEEGISLWDYRKPREILVHYDSTVGETSGISVCFNSTGTRLLALRRRLPPVLYATQSQSAICQFYHPQYYNSCTMKTCCFAGENDEYILSGSDDFNLYMWQIPKTDSEWGKTHLVLKGHRSIVNQVRYNKHNNLIASSGVEKMVKLWSTLPIGTWEGSFSKDYTETPRVVYSHDDYIYLIGHSGQRISHDYSDQSTQEDSRMMAFFDSLIQREIEGWDPSSDITFTTDSETDVELQDQLYLPRDILISSRRYQEECNKKHKPNRIAQLIAQKRRLLARMARYKSSTLVHRYNQKRNCRKRKSSCKLKSSASLHNHNNSYNYHGKFNGITKKTSCRCSSRLTSSFGGASCMAKQTRKHKLHTDKSDKWAKLKKVRTRQAFKDISENSISNSSIDAPSTSTGITGSSNSVFRVIEQDSEEELPLNGCIENGNQSEENLVNILPTPLNGTHDICLSTLDMSTPSNNRNVVALSNEDYTNAEEGALSASNTIDTISKQMMGPHNLDNSFASIFNNSDLDNNDTDMYVNSDVFVNGNSHLVVNDSDSSDCEYEYTPVKKKRCGSDMGTPDSGFATGPCSSGSNGAYSVCGTSHRLPCSSRSTNLNYNGHSSDESDFAYERFKKRSKKTRLNFRKHIVVDSDSN